MKEKSVRYGDIKSDVSFDTMKNGSGRDIWIAYIKIPTTCKENWEIFSAVGYVKRMQKLIEEFVPHLIALNFGNEQLRRVTDPKKPRLPIGDPLVGIDFSSSPNFVRANMSQHDYQNGQTFGLFSFVAFWVGHDKTLRKAVYPMPFVDPTHSVERVCQGLDYGLEELESEMFKESVVLKNLYVYSDCAPGV